MSSKRKFFWENYSYKKLLELRLCDLKLSLHDSLHCSIIEQLYQEIADKGLRFKPHFWISEEWFSPDGVPGVAIPFYLLHPKLVRLEEKMVFEAEGKTKKWFMRLLRHECAHALDNAFLLRRKRKRQKLFGLTSVPYNDFYHPNPYDQSYVVNLDSWYAQAHPDEDWAETFAVWLNPESNWQVKYREWPAYEKLLYVDQVMGELVGKKPIVQNKRRVDPLDHLKDTLGEFYLKKRQHYQLEKHYFFAPDLHRIFSNEDQFNHRPLAVPFIKRNRKLLQKRIGKFCHQYQYTVFHIINLIIDYCEKEKLRMRQGENESLLDLTALLAGQCSYYLTSGHHKIIV